MHLRGVVVAALGALLAWGCDCSAEPAGAACESMSDCRAGMLCVDGRCRAGSDGGGMDGASGDDATGTCDSGVICAGACCRLGERCAHETCVPDLGACVSH